MDLPANVTFIDHPDGWTLDQESDVFRSVQAFYNSGSMTIELWGTSTLVSPSGRRLEAKELQQLCRVNLSNGTWSAQRIIYGVIHDDHDVSNGVKFERSGGLDDIAAARRI